MVIEKKPPMTSNYKKMSRQRMIFLFLFCLIFSVYLFYWSVPHIYGWAMAMILNHPALFYGPKDTALIGGSVITFFYSIRVLALKEKAAQLDKYFITISILSAFLMFIFPSIMESVVKSYVKEHQYGYCAGASYKGLDCYTIDENTCLIETAKREKILKDFWGE